MIVNGYEMDFSKQNFGVILYGAPGLGKTTLALSDGKLGEDTLLIDLERGVGRTKAEHRYMAKVLTATNYDEVLADLKTPEALAAKTIVIDTCGALVEYLKSWAMDHYSDARTKNGTFNNMKGFGYVKSEIERFTNSIKNEMHKNIVYIFHSDEKADKDGNPIQRLRCEGSFRNTVWTGIDFGAYIQMLGNKRYACFSPDQEYFAKGCHGIEGNIEIPNLNAEGAVNDFLAKMFDKARANMAAENTVITGMKGEYEAVMAKVKEIIAGVKDAETATAAATSIPAMEHKLTSKAEASAMLQAKTKELGLKWDKVLKAYYSETPAEAPTAAPAAEPKAKGKTKKEAK